MYATGYVHNLIDNNLSFKDWVLSCARNFGACIAQKDESIDSLPKFQEPSSYYSKELKKMEEKYDDMVKWDTDKIKSFYSDYKSQTIKDLQNSKEKELAKIGKAKHILAMTRKWVPPTPEHENLKKFMIEQLTISLEDTGVNSYYDDSIQELQNSDETQMWVDELINIKKDIARYKQRHEEELKRVNERNEWIRQLYNSLE